MAERFLWWLRAQWHLARGHNCIRCSDGWFCVYDRQEWGA